MKSIALYVEGGGDSEAGKAALRQGLDELLFAQKSAARASKIRWKTVLCGGRDAAFGAFANATEKVTADVVVLLVDAEEPVKSTDPAGRVAHLVARDHWEFADVDPNRVHLMTECMEAWIVADPNALEKFYGKGFRRNSLPRRQLLDEEPKNSLFDALAAATKETQKGSYGKISHASELLKRVSADVVAARCSSFQKFTKWLDAALAGG